MQVIRIDLHVNTDLDIHIATEYYRIYLDNGKAFEMLADDSDEIEKVVSNINEMLDNDDVFFFMEEEESMEDFVMNLYMKKEALN